MIRPIRFLSICVLAISFVAITGCSSRDISSTAAMDEKPVENIEFSGKALLVVSDGDQGAFGYAFGNLNRVPGVIDAFSAISFPGASPPKVSSVKVSNSVVSWPQVMDVSPDGKRAYVIETRGEPPMDVSRVGNVFYDLPVGKNITIVDITDIENPFVLNTAEIGENLESVSVSPDGKWLAVNTADKENQILIFSVEGDKIGKIHPFNNIFDDNEIEKIGSLRWHPSGEYLAIVWNSSVKFMKFSYDTSSRKIDLSPHGNTLNAGICLSSGQFTPNGNYFIVPDVHWKDMFLGTLFNKRGLLISISFDRTPDPDGTIEHKEVSRALVGRSPEGFAMSPDGSLLVAVNMERTYIPSFPLGFWPGRSEASLSLVKLNTASGELETLPSQYKFKGCLPEDAVFDAKGEKLAVTIYHYDSDTPRSGYLELWDVIDGDQPELSKTGKVIKVPRGPHNVVLVK